MDLPLLHSDPTDQARMSAADAGDLVVLKFGSSVLRSVENLPAVAGEIYRQRRAGLRVIAVVSALAGETDRLFAEAATAAGGTNCAGIPDLVSLGEERTAALLAIACRRIGLHAETVRAEALGLVTTGDPLSAHPVRLDAANLLDALGLGGVAVVPGFVGTGADGRRTLLGRGGSDFSAIYLAGELGARCVRLYKDVDGVFDRDPASSIEARRHEEISWQEALKVARPLVQPQAVEYAALRRLPIEVTAIGSTACSRIGPRSSAPKPAPRQRPLRVAIAGFGVVGQALAARLRGEPRFEFSAVLLREPAKARAVVPPSAPTACHDTFLGAEADIVVEALSCEATGAALCIRALARGTNVVTASKRVVSGWKDALDDAQREGTARLAYSAAVGGGATILELVERARAAGEVAGFGAILNGTTNFILDRLAGGQSFAEALDAAQAAGFAEANSDFDLSGQDAAAKLRIVARHAFDAELGEIDAEWLDEAAAERIAASGERWVQLARLERRDGRIEGSVTLVPLSEAAGLPEAPEEWNSALVTLADGRSFACTGRGAGGAATAEAIVADLYDIAASLAIEDAAVELEAIRA